MDSTSLSIRVEDSGIGIAKEDQKRIFERFYQGHKKEGSTGLGLALAESVCKSSGLDIRYEFTEGMHRFTVSCSGSERVG